MKKLSILFLIFIIGNSAFSQDINITGINVIIDNLDISDKISDYKIYKIDLSEFEYKNELEFNLNLGTDHFWNLHLTKNNLRSEGYESYLTTKQGIKKNTDIVRTYKGYLNNNKDNIIRISIHCCPVNPEIINFLFVKF